MTLETALGSTSTDSYGTLLEYQAYGVARGWTLGVDDSADEVNLRLSFDAINRNWSYSGYPVDQAVQAGAWPRYDVVLTNGYVQPSDMVPRNVINAQFELAYLLQGGLVISPTISESTTSQSLTVGPISISSDSLPTGAPRVSAVDVLLGPFLAVGGSWGRSSQAKMVRG
jgi:hypothetical protein